MLSVDVAAKLGAFSLQAKFETGSGVTALFGPSGAGKSSVLAMVAGALRPDRGRIVLAGDVLFDSATGVDTAMERRGIGWVFQDARLFPHMSVRGNLDYGARRTRGRSVIAKFDDVVGVLGIGHLLERRPSGLSGGERQRVAVGRALLAQPRLLLMDEPLAALDHARRAEVMPYLARLSREIATPTLYVTHSLTEVVRLADQIVVIDEGAVQAAGSLASVAFSSPLLNRRPDAALRLEGLLRQGESGPGGRAMSRVETPAGDILVPQLDGPSGAPVRLVVLARDVMLAVGERPKGLSARNILPAEVDDLVRRGDGAVTVRLRLAGGVSLFSSVTEDAVDALSLAPGVAVFAIIKSVAVEGGRPDGLIDLMDD